MTDPKRSPSDYERAAWQAVTMYAALAGGVAGFAGGVAVGERLRPSELEEARSRLHSVLKDSQKTDQLIEKLKDQSFTKDLLDDPEIAKNLSKLTAAVMGHAQETLDETVKKLKERKALTKEWTKELERGQDSGVLQELFPHLRPEPPKRSF